tara:strand:+ start:647 stop:2092 length:1446 start_codon:yes stop_codon:yes gene_type:complete
MKRFILFTFSLLLTFTFAIAQDGINYQGAATDGNGDELTNQNITIRASVLSGSASGNLEWEETHSATTDQFGLFNVVIGQGTNTTNGATATFNDMDWGSGNHFLKIEMDATGGTNYAMIGTTQMMSVPYALYAKSAGIDSTMLANMIGSSGGGMGGGCDWQFPEGINGDPVVIDFLATSGYTVPSGKNLYITTSYYSNGSTTYITINGNTIVQAGNFGTPVIAKSGDVVHYMSISNLPTLANCTGILVDINPQVEPIFVDLLANNYTVPNGKTLFITKGNHTGQTGYITVDGQKVCEAWNIPLPHIIKSGVIVGFTGPPTTVSFTGYLVDENYFAGCGGGGSSSASAGLDSATVATMIANAGPTFISPINILNYYCNGADTLIINIDSLLYQHPSSIILHVEANILGANAGWNVLELKSYNGLFETPVCHWHRQQSGIYNNTYHNFTTQVTIPNNHVNGIIELRMPQCKANTRIIEIVGYY